MTRKNVAEHQPPRAVCLRLDNVVLDARAFVRICADKALSEHGLAPLSEHEHRSLFLDGEDVGFITVLLHRESITLDHDLTDTLTARYQELFVDRFETAIEPVRGMPELLEELAGAGIGVSGVTGLKREHAEALLDRYGLSEHFTTISCLDDLDSRPSEGQLAREGLFKLESEKPPHIAMISDNHHDLEASRQLGVRSIVARWGITPSMSIEILAQLGIESVATPAALLSVLAPFADSERVQRASIPPTAVIAKLEGIVFDLSDTADAIWATLGIDPRTAAAMATDRFQAAYNACLEQTERSPIHAVRRRLNTHISPRRTRDLDVQSRLLQLKHEGVRLAAYTNLDEEVALGMLTMLGLVDMFHAVCARDIADAESAAGAFHSLRQDLAVKDPAECVVITDDVRDILAAVRDGSEAIGITWGTALVPNFEDRAELSSLDHAKIQIADSVDQLDDAVRDALLMWLNEKEV